MCACVSICFLAFDPTHVDYISPPPSVERQSGKSLTMERINFFSILFVSTFISVAFLFFF